MVGAPVKRASRPALGASLGALGKPAPLPHIARMERRFFLLIAGVIAAGAGTVLIAALVTPMAAGLPVAGTVLALLALLLLLARYRRRG